MGVKVKLELELELELEHVSLIMVGLDFLMFIFSTVPDWALRRRNECAQ